MQTKPFAVAALLTAVAAGPAAAASIDLSKDFQARGAKPDWALKVSNGTQFVLTRPGKPALQAAAPGAAISGSGVSWRAKAADGRPLNVSLQNGTCTVGGLQYPMTAKVVLGAESLSGCAGPTP